MKNNPVKMTKDIYTSILDMNDDSFSYWLKRANKDLVWFHAKVSKILKNKSEIKILLAGGTGRQALAAVNAGYGKVVYVDLSSLNTRRIISFKEQHKITNLEVINGDMFDTIPGLGRFDIVYCEGVLQHLADPTKGVQMLVKALNTDGILYADLYRAGILFWLLVDSCRTLFTAEDYRDFEFYLDNLMMYDYKIGFSSGTLGQRLGDDLFIPCVRSYFENTILKTINQSGLEVVYADNLKEIEHDLPAHKYFRFILKNNAKADVSKIEIKEISNLKIEYTDNWINETIKKLNRFTDHLKSKDQVFQFTTIVGLFLRFDDWTKAALQSREVHKELQGYIDKVISH